MLMFVGRRSSRPPLRRAVPPGAPALSAGPARTAAFPVMPAPPDGAADRPPVPVERRYESEQALVLAMGDKVQYSWDRYITFIHEILLLTGGTILVLINGMIGREQVDPLGSTWVGLSALSVAVLGMLAGMGWRLTSQFFMDREVFGNRDDVDRYYRLAGFDSLSDYPSKYYSDTAVRVWKPLFQVSSYAAIACLLAAWILGGVFVALNA